MVMDWGVQAVCFSRHSPPNTPSSAAFYFERTLSLHPLLGTAKDNLDWIKEHTNQKPILFNTIMIMSGEVSLAMTEHCGYAFYCKYSLKYFYPDAIVPLDLHIFSYMKLHWRHLQSDCNPSWLFCLYGWGCSLNCLVLLSKTPEEE